MSVYESGKGYYARKVFLQEAVAAEYGLGSTTLGYDDVPTTFRRWLKEDNLLTGGKWLRKQENAPDTIYDTVFGTDQSVSRAYAAAGQEEKKAVARAVIDAMKDAQEPLRKVLHIGYGAAGKNWVECLPIEAYFVHERNRNGQPFIHGHKLSSRAGVNVHDTRETRRIRNCDELVNLEMPQQRIFQASLAHRLQQYVGIETELKDGKCVVPAVPREVAKKTSTRRQEALEWCKRNGYGANPKPWEVTRGIRETRKRRVAHDRPKAHREWKEQADRECPGLDKRMKMQPGQKPNAWLGNLLHTYLTTPWKVIYEGIKAAHRKDPHAVAIGNIDVFLYQVSKRPAIEGHRAALHAMRWGTFSSIKEALKAAERAYKEARRPKLHLERGAKVIVSQIAVTTPQQRDRLEQLAEQKGWTVAYEDKRLQQQHEQRQQQKQGPSMAQGVRP